MNDQRSKKDLARTITRESLARSESFHQLALEEQKTAYLELYRQNLTRLSGDGSGALSPVKPFCDHASTGREKVGDFLDEVDFPAFIQGLLAGVFQANLDAALAQMDAYADLLRDAARSVSDFVDDIDDSEARSYLAESKGDEFVHDRGEGGEESGITELRHRKPAVQAINSAPRNAVSPLNDVKIRMAQEQRAVLREIIVIYIQRIALERGSSSLLG